MPDGVEELPVSEDADLLPVEKQLSLTTTKDDEEFTIHSEVASVTRWLVDHPAFEMKQRRVRDGHVVSVTGTIPVGMVGLKGRPRNANHFSRMLGSATKRGQGETDA